MTILALESAVSSDLKNDKVFSCHRPISPESFKSEALPRFNLRKRSCSQNISPEVNLVAVNSAFLSGLFADVSAAQSNTFYVEATPCASQASLAEAGSSDVDILFESQLPNKKSRVDLHRSLSRCGKSMKTLNSLANATSSPTEAMTNFFDPPEACHKIYLNHSDSLHFQLSCVADQASTDYSAGGTATSVSLIFPHLPNTISNSSCASSLTRNISDLQSSVAGANAEKEVGYGWFVEMEDETHRDEVNPYSKSQVDALAFCAPTAPKAANYDDELEWAKAADTVDDVLRDFF